MRFAAVVLIAVATSACVTPPVLPPPANATATTAVTTAPSAPVPSVPGSVPTAPPTTSPTTTSQPGFREAPPLAALRISDAPPPAGYRRDDWPHWRDTDGDGCDARPQALRAASEIPAQPTSGCTVLSGRWISAYDGVVTTEPTSFDVDHVVPLADAHRSGGATWSTDRRALFANDQANLWVVSAASNRSKSDRSPDDWRPARQAVWCTYATRWLQIKVRWELTATTSERDALGTMLDSCPPGGPADTRPATPMHPPAAADTTPPAAPPASTIPAAPPSTAIPAPPTTTGTPTTVHYRNCAEARAAGVTPLHRDDPGYRKGLDGDSDGVACE